MQICISHKCVPCGVNLNLLIRLNINLPVVQVACMQFINIVVHSVEDMNFRVHLQYDFTKLNLDDHLEVTANHTQTHDALSQSLTSVRYRASPAAAEAHGERPAAGADPGVSGQRVRRGDAAGRRRDQDGGAGARGGAGGEPEHGEGAGPGVRGGATGRRGNRCVCLVSSDVGAAAGRGERGHVEDRGAGEAADADEQGAGPAAGQLPWRQACVSSQGRFSRRPVTSSRF